MDSRQEGNERMHSLFSMDAWMARIGKSAVERHGFEIVRENRLEVCCEKQLAHASRVQFEAEFVTLGFRSVIFARLAYFNQELALCGRIEGAVLYNDLRFMAGGHQAQYGAGNAVTRALTERRIRKDLHVGLRLVTHCQETVVTLLSCLERREVARRLCMGYQMQVEALAACMVASGEPRESLEAMFARWLNEFRTGGDTALEHWLIAYRSDVLRLNFS